ncbi:MotA/TolQ/ExbB proton channel family protein [Desulfogranum mediterraneum]|uniref:MotA/TolQ/ExbB proton channel family protein n=1 Tax=Desulfogranum mediterraneum TaxID=160661 RepID=UPI0003FA0348|nr:MotA/TolQ/ExbB proton channel family protein [Desulfogranum mediterraneum]
MSELIRQQYLLLEKYFCQGGPLMGPLLLLSLVMWLLIIERSLFLGRLYRRNMSHQVAREHLLAGERPDPRQYKGVVSLLVSRFLRQRSGEVELDRFILDEVVLGINHRLNDHLATIGVLAAIAPLFGLLGTVTGMISTFDVLALFGTGNSKAMAGGISEALITTQTGLLVAVPGLYMKNFLSRRADNLQQRVATAGLYLRRALKAADQGEPSCST